MNILYSQSHLSLNYKVVFSILFILNPTVASLLILFFLSGKSCKVNHVFLGMILSAYVSLINVTKVPVNDLESYLEYFSAAGDMSLYEYLFYWNKYKAGVESLKEPAYAVFSYFSYHILGGNQKAFVFLFSFTSCVSLPGQSFRTPSPPRLSSSSCGRSQPTPCRTVYASVRR